MKLKLNSLLLLLSLKTSIYGTVLTPVKCIPTARQLELNKALSKKVKDQTFDEAVLAKNYYKNTNDYETAIKCAERILAAAPYSERLDHAEIMRTTLFELIQFCFKQQYFEKAQKYAHEYQTLYLATPECQEASYYGVRAYFAATLSSDRDQSYTQKALEHAQEFIKRYPDDIEYCAPVKSIIVTCYTKLLESELQVIKSYLSRYKRRQEPALLTAAQKRIEYIQEKLLSCAPAQKEQVTRVQEQIAQAYALHNRQSLQKGESTVNKTAVLPENTIPILSIVEKP
jgi:outer membrane protein assembly factor BamD (BamD/ComL family)